MHIKKIVIIIAVFLSIVYAYQQYKQPVRATITPQKNDLKKNVIICNSSTSTTSENGDDYTTGTPCTDDNGSECDSGNCTADTCADCIDSGYSCTTSGQCCSSCCTSNGQCGSSSDCDDDSSSGSSSGSSSWTGVDTVITVGSVLGGPIVVGKIYNAFKATGDTVGEGTVADTVDENSIDEYTADEDTTRDTLVRRDSRLSKSYRKGYKRRYAEDDLDTFNNDYFEDSEHPDDLPEIKSEVRLNDDIGIRKIPKDDLTTKDPDYRLNYDPYDEDEENEDLDSDIQAKLNEAKVNTANNKVIAQTDVADAETTAETTAETEGYTQESVEAAAKTDLADKYPTVAVACEDDPAGCQAVKESVEIEIKA